MQCAGEEWYQASAQLRVDSDEPRPREVARFSYWEVVGSEVENVVGWEVGFEVDVELRVAYLAPAKLVAEKTRF